MAFTAVQDMLDNLKRLDIQFEASEALNDTADSYTNLQRKQLFAGVKEDNEKILPEYTPRTVAIKKKKGQPTDRVTLKDKEDFYKGIFVDSREEVFIVDSADEKTGDLIEKYGDEIFGLNEENQKVFVENNLDDVFMNRIEKATGL